MGLFALEIFCEVLLPGWGNGMERKGKGIGGNGKEKMVYMKERKGSGLSVIPALQHTPFHSFT